MDEKKITSALISVYDKEGIDEVATYLHSKGVVIYSTGGTQKHLEEIGVPVSSVESLTGFPEMLGGRVKTLHPMIFGGILNRRDDKKDKKDVTKHKIKQIDLVIVDLYPFEETVADEESTHEEIIEKIDIGGVSLIRAAAKNYEDVLVISSRKQYGTLLDVLGDSCSSKLSEREEFAIDAFNHTSNYDHDVFRYLLGEDLVQTSTGSQTPSVGLNLSITKDDSLVNDYIYCWDSFGERPNRIVIHNTYSTKLFDKIMKERFLSKNVFTEVIPDSVEVIVNDRILAKIDESCYISYIVADRNMDSSFIDSITFFYKETYHGIEDMLQELNDCILDYCEEDSNKLNAIVLSPTSGLELEPMSIREEETDTDLFYSAETFKRAQKTIKAIKKAEKGLVIFHGERGTGKTSMISHIASKLDRIVIFVPLNMIDHTFNNPDFRKFVKKYDKPLLVVDDCESIFEDVYKSVSFTGNVMQMVEGFLSESVGATVLMIFNEKSDSEIDEVLLECNELIDVVEFEWLSEEEATELAKHLGKSKPKGRMRVVDVVKKRKSPVESNIGF